MPTFTPPPTDALLQGWSVVLVGHILLPYVFKPTPGDHDQFVDLCRSYWAVRGGRGLSARESGDKASHRAPSGSQPSRSNESSGKPQTIGSADGSGYLRLIACRPRRCLCNLCRAL